MHKATVVIVARNIQVCCCEIICYVNLNFLYETSFFTNVNSLKVSMGKKIF